ncbi:RNA polymerase sigma-70 factor [Reichenbachiella sp. MALMAid0571]|uniref:RNA polymerase sigma-70 factor n=1 Tax=Reichenbachiella sp. MALMAid0571 TaxID=3143939 RepID=UPI0032DE2BC3
MNILQATPTQNITNLKDSNTFESVFRAYYSQLAAFAYQYVSNSDLAEEIVQEMFGNLWEKADNITIKTSLKSYLYGSVRNACLNHLKHQKVKKQHEEYEKGKSDYHEIDYLELDELQDKIDEALNKLPAKCREIFELSRFEEMKYKEIAQELNISIKTVESQMGRALKVMRDTLGKYLPGFIPWLLYFQKYI